MGSNKVIKGVNDLLSKNSFLAAEWNYTKNGDLHPDEVAYQSNKKVWWACRTCGYEWQSTVNNRNRGNGCPCCSNQAVVTGINDLLTKNKSLALDWCYEKNTTISPDKIVSGSGEKVWWKCHVCGHEWMATVVSRDRGAGCPKCGEKKSRMNFHKAMIENRGSLASTHPQLADEWNHALNAPLLPSDVLAGSNQKVWWKCLACGYEWQATIHSRSNGIGCPFCANKAVIKGVNDLETLRPDLVKEWLYSKNSVSPLEVTIGSGKKVWWHCSICGHEWLARIADRAKHGTACPMCASRLQTSFPEQAVFYYIKQCYPDAMNRYTELFGNTGMELDIFIPSLKFAIEYDGSAWHNSASALKREAKKFAYCQKHCITLCRIKEQDDAPAKISEHIADHILFCRNHPDNKELDRIISEIAALLSVKLDADVARDSLLIREQYYRQLEENSLSKTHPELLSEWNYEKNGKILPSMISSGNQNAVWWKCSMGHEWKVSSLSRVYFKSGCPYCSNRKVLRGFNDLATTHPEVLWAWDSERNKSISPDEITSANTKVAVWWICKHGHHFQTSVYGYLHLSNEKCPICSGKQVLAGHNDLATISPELVCEWNYEKNDILPTEVTRGSQKKVWWKCSLGHEWQTTVANRTSQRTGCPYCASKKLLKGFNDLQTHFPSLAEEWDVEKNNISPSETVSGSSRKVWWKCKKCGYGWIASVVERTHGKGCPACAHLVVNPGVTDFETRFPDRAKWWNYSKNGDLLPSMVNPYSEKKVWWKCDKGHDFYRAVKYASRGQGCPICKKRNRH